MRSLLKNWNDMGSATSCKFTATRNALLSIVSNAPNLRHHLPSLCPVSLFYQRNVTPSKEASIQAGVPNFFEKRDRFRYKRVSVYDAPTSAPQLLEAADSVVKFISDGLHHGSVLVHCQHGVSRSTTCVLFYLIRCVTLYNTIVLGSFPY